MEAIGHGTVQTADNAGDGAYWMPHDDEALRLDLIA